MIAIYALLALLCVAIWTAVVVGLGASWVVTTSVLLVCYAVAVVLLGLAAAGADVATRAGRSR